jgi:hypothetical protein
MRWLTTADAQRLGIEYRFVPAPVPATLNVPSIAAPAPASVATARSPEQIAWEELNARLNLSELKLRGEVGDAKVDALIVWVKAQATNDATLLPKLYAQLDPYRLAYGLMSAAIAPPVVSPVSANPAQVAAALTPAYAQGRQARLDYEQWFVALPPGNYRDGATFWASNRSLKPPPTCTNGAIPAWQQGCVDGRARLAPVDQRRRTEPSYWWGWNSL